MIEHHLQALDEQRLTVSETFAEVRGARIRYRLVGADQRPDVRTDAERRIDAVGLRLNHWWAVDREWFVAGEIARQAQATRDFGDLPLLVLTGSVSADGDAGHAWLELYRWLASRSSRGVVRQLPGVEHSGFLEEPAAQSLIESIREMLSEIH